MPQQVEKAYSSKCEKAAKVCKKWDPVSQEMAVGEEKGSDAPGPFQGHQYA